MMFSDESTFTLVKRVPKMSEGSGKDERSPKDATSSE